MLILLFALSLGLAVFLAAQAATYPARQRRAVAARATRYGGVERARPERRETPHVPLGTLLLRPFAALAAPLVPPKARRNNSKRLLAAGLAQTLTPEQLLGWKGVGATSGLLLGALAGAATKPVLGIFVGVMIGMLGFLIPDVLVNSRFISRRDRVQSALPDALDLLAVSVEAGLAMDGAIAKLTEYMHGPLIDEFAHALNEMRMGESRIEALKRMAARLDVPELSSFVRAVIQADQLGASIGATLRVQAADARTRRQVAAEEKAMKAPIKMLFPMVLFILPAMFIVVLWPALQRFGS